MTARISTMLQMVLAVRWAAAGLGNERFGVWATFSALTTMLSLLDLGVGNALVNRVAHANAQAEPKDLNSVVAAGLGWLAVMGILASAVLAATACFAPWQRLFKLSGPGVADEARFAALLFSGFFGLNLVASGLLKVLVGLQRSYESQLITAGGAIASCAMLYIVVQHRVTVGSLLSAGFGVQCILTLCAVAILLCRRGLLRFRDIGKCMSAQRASLLSSGFLFFVLQVGTMVGWGSDTFLIASIAGASDVAAFAVVQRLFQFASQPGAMLNSSLWAAYADAYVRADRAFLRKTFRMSLLFSAGAGITISLVLLAFGPVIIDHWTKGTIAVSTALTAAFAVWTLLDVCGTTLGVYLNGVGIVREQVVVVICFCVVALPLKVLATMRYGATGLVFATSAAYLMTTVFLYGTVFRRRVMAPLTLQVNDQ